VLLALWSALLTAIIYLIGLGVGMAVDLPPVPAAIFWQGTVIVAITTCLNIALATPIAFFAGLGRGYLAPMGAAILALILAQIIAATGWGDYFPWSVPALYAGVAGPDYAQLGPVSYVIVVLTSLVGMIGTFVWWEVADQAS